MLLITPSSSVTSCGATSSKSCRVYRHEPYAARLLMQEDYLESPTNSICTVRRRSLPSWADTEAGAQSPCNRSFLECAVLPPVHSSIPPNTILVVGFKFGEKYFRAPFTTTVGELVVVEGDRGMDMGVVVGVATADRVTANVDCVYRKATAADKEHRLLRMKEEERALEKMRRLAKQADFPAHIESVMLQLDGKKITAIISREGKALVDFRRLQRAAFEVFRCRVWFSYLDEIEATMSTEVQKPALPHPRKPERRANVRETHHSRTSRRNLRYPVAEAYA